MNIPRTNDPYTTNVARNMEPSLPDVVVVAVVLDCCSNLSDAAEKLQSSSKSVLCVNSGWNKCFMLYAAVLRIDFIVTLALLLLSSLQSTSSYMHLCVDACTGTATPTTL